MMFHDLNKKHTRGNNFSAAGAALEKKENRQSWVYEQLCFMKIVKNLVGGVKIPLLFSGAV